MIIKTLKTNVAALLISLASSINLCVASPNNIGSSGVPDQHSSASHEVWEANENGTTYQITKISDDRFLIVYGNKEDTSGYIVYDLRDGSKGTEYVPWTSASSDITVGIQQTSSHDIGVMLSSGGQTVSFVAKPYRPRNRIQASIRSGNWSAVISGKPVQFRIDRNLVDASVKSGACKLVGKITRIGSGNEAHLTLLPSKEQCSSTFDEGLDATLQFTDDLVIIHTEKRKSINFIFVGAPSTSSLPFDRRQARSMACAQWRATCREKCSASPLPSGDFGFRFWNCVNSCAAQYGCI
ncbi:hypothetical protein [Burkholderia stagnalis]